MNPGDERYTPPWLFMAMDADFDVDLAAPKGGVEWIPAKRYYTKDDDALTKNWSGEFAWCNPPFSMAAAFGRKWVSEVEEGVWLGPLSHGSEYTADLLRGAEAIVIPRDIKFVWANGHEEGIGFPVFLCGWGDRGGAAIRSIRSHNKLYGAFLHPLP